MIQKNIVLLAISVFLCISCQKEDELTTNTQQDMKQVSLSLSLDNGLEAGTEYVPMGARADDTNIFITNTYHYIIAKKTEDGRYVVANKGEAKLKPDGARYALVDIIHNEPHESFNILLRPGEYEMMVFTGAYSIVFNTAIKEGTVLPDPGDKANQLWAITYETSREHENEGDKVIGEEIFFGRTSFTVEKTDYLSKENKPNIVPIKIELTRRVTKLRVLLKETINPAGNLVTIKSLLIGNRQPVITLDIIKENGEDFASGLDVWGNLCSQTGESISTFRVCTQLGHEPKLGDDGLEYYIGNSQEKVYYPYVFCMPGEEIKVKTGQVKCSIGTLSSGLIYNGSHELILKNNTINGIVFELTDQYDAKNILLAPVYTSGTNLLIPDKNLFENNYEYRPK